MGLAARSAQSALLSAATERTWRPIDFSGYDALVDHLQQLRDLLEADLSYPGGHDGRGIVVSAGGRLLPGAYVALRSLRRVGCTIPVEIWHLGPAELPRASLCTLFERQGVTFVDAHQVAREHGRTIGGGWQNKPFSILFSHFAEVLLLDADNMALQDPSRLFDDEAYLKTGALLWPDFPQRPGSRWSLRPEVWALLGLAERTGVELESGQLVFDKRKTWRALSVALHMNEHSDFWYRYSYGDKDTFTLAFAVTDTPATVVGKGPVHLQRGVRIHFAPDGREIFQHCRKWTMPPAANWPMLGYRLEPLCMEWMKEYAGA